MSESLPITKETPPNPKEATQSPRVVMVTAILTAITTIGVSFIGIVPQLRGGDTKEIIELRKQLGEIATKAEAASAPALPGKKQNVKGKATSLDGKQEAMNGIEVYLIPAGNLLTATTNEEGEFDFTEIPAGPYSIFMRNSTQGASGRNLLLASQHELNFKWVGARVNYHITPAP